VTTDASAMQRRLKSIFENATVYDDATMMRMAHDVVQ
jgi:hypothetical protein